MNVECLIDVIELFIFLLSYVAVIVLGHFFVRGILDMFPVQKEVESLRGAGAIIGVLERVFTLTLVLVGEYTAIMLVLTAKSIARFEDLKKRDFAEYYLIGTFSSILFALIVGIYWSWLLEMI